MTIYVYANLLSCLGRLVEEEKKEKGVVSYGVYKAYWKSAGSVLAISIFMFLFLMQGNSLLPYFMGFISGIYKTSIWNIFVYMEYYFDADHAYKTNLSVTHFVCFYSIYLPYILIVWFEGYVIWINVCEFYK